MLILETGLTHIDSSSLPPGWPPQWCWSRADTVSVKLSRGSEEVSALDKHVNSGVKLSGF